MRKFIFLMLVLISKLIFCQNINTNPSEKTKCIPVTQINEVYKGLKQNEQLKKLLNSAQETIDNSNMLIASQKILNSKISQESAAKSELINDLNNLSSADKNLCDIQKESLINDLKYLEQKSKKESRNSFWKGVKVGGISVVVLGAAAFVLINN